jgi:ubiquinone/menaquinone biosynthesis C-methylase UbiE
VAWQLAQRHRGLVCAVDIVDCRKRRTSQFALYDGINLPFGDASCDVVNLSFTLHHIPNETKPSVIAEVRRVVRRAVVVMEDTPRNFIDRYYNRRHGEEFRRSIGSTAAYGFYTQKEWEAFFAAHGFAIVQTTRIGRFARDWEQPFARTCFVLEKV